MTAKEIYKKGLKNPAKELFNELLQKDKTGGWIYEAGKDWKNFDYNKGFNALIKKDKSGLYIYGAGVHWPKFDYDKGFNELIQKDRDGKLINWAGLNWKKFDYAKALKILKDNFPKYYKKALKNWPKGEKELSHLNKQLNKNKIIKPKKFSIKEEILSLL